jgi:acyl dehydratase
MTRWYEDIVIDEVFHLGEHEFTEPDIIAFAKLYDPQYFHTDPEAAKAGPFGGLVASGWHTACVGQYLFITRLEAEKEKIIAAGEEPGISGPSPGVNTMDFKTPVRPGDTVRYELKVTSKRPSKSLPGWGVMIHDFRAFNQRGELVFVEELAAFLRMRDFKMPLRMRLGMALMKLPGGKVLLGRR